MNFCGLISEFNPFHNGHEYIIREAKKLTDCEIICLMSGNFVQRGTPAIVDKFARAKCAISAGANVVLELPAIFACSNAENFAFGAIKIFKALGVKKLAFGIENTNLEILQKIAALKFENSEKFQIAFKNEIENGINYNTALKRSITKCLGEDVKEILDKPNNILAIEYLTAIKKLDANITPVAIARIDNGYNSTVQKGSFLSASAIRDLAAIGKDYSKFIPAYCNLDNHFNLQHQISYEVLLVSKLRTLSATELEKHYDYTEGIEYRVKKIADEKSTLAEMIDGIATPRYRVSRVNKLLLYPLLGITKNAAAIAKETKPAVKVLAINKNNKELLKTFNKKKINLLVTSADYETLSKKQRLVSDIDLHSSNIYNTIIQKPNNLDKKTGTMFI